MSLSPRWRVFPAVVTVLVAVVAIAHLIARPAPTAPVIANTPDHVLVIAHQGGNHIRPDNTLLAFDHAHELGADLLEMDINMTADGELVVIHDTTVDRTTNGNGAVRNLTLAEIQSLDAAYYWTPLDPDGSAPNPDDHPYRGQGITVPTLRAVFATYPNTLMTIELKQETPSMAVPFCNLIHEYNMQDKLIVASFSVAALVEFREGCPDVATSAHRNEVITFYVLYRAFLGQTWHPGAVTALQVPRSQSGLPIMQPRFVRAAHGRNVQVQPWTINRPDEMQRMLDMGVDGIMTDQPGLLLELLGR